jgi:hypothetical protein
MTYPTSTKDNLLNGQTFTHASLHTAFPGTTGANEVTGGAPAYARKAITMNASAGGSGRVLNAAVTFDVPATTVRWIGGWNGAAFVGPAPNGGATPKNFMALPSTDIVYLAGHGWSDGQKIVFFQGSVGGITEGTIYYTRDSTIDTFKVAATPGGAAIDITASPSFGCVVCAITEDVYAAQNTHQLATASMQIPD